MALSDFSFNVGELDQEISCDRPQCRWTRDMWWHLGESAPGVGFTLADAVIFAQQHDQEEHGVI